MNTPEENQIKFINKNHLYDKGEMQVDSSKIDPRNNLNDLSSKEWIVETVSVWFQRGLGAKHPDAQIEKQHPAPFSFTDVIRLIRFFTKTNQTVLDPFVGVGSTLKACALTNRFGIGFELNPCYAKLAKERLDKETRSLFSYQYPQTIRVGDAMDLSQELDQNSIDFILTSPPYWNILHKQDHKTKQERIAHNLDTRYSDDERDLGNIDDYDKFLEKLSRILGNCVQALKPQKYMALIVSDFRNKSKYIMFHAHLVEALEPYNLELRGIKILYQRHKRVFPYGYPYAYVPNIHHQYILILQNTRQ
jgi:DNA modification methylase